MSLYAHCPIAGSAPEPEFNNSLRLSGSLLSASGSFPILAALFEEAVEAVCLTLSQSLPYVAAAAAVAVVEAASESTAAVAGHVNPSKPSAVSSAVVVEASSVDVTASTTIDEVFDDYAYDGLDVDPFDEWDYEEDKYDFECLERCAFGSRKLERIVFKATSCIPLRATKTNKTENVRPNKRYGHRLVAKMERSKANKLDNMITRKHGRPPIVYWQPHERRTKTNEERDLEEALVRSRREGHISRNININSLLDLQNRELTPEDYELLLMLDETVEKKKVSKDTFSAFPQTVLAQDAPVDCPICMSPMAKGEKITTLPCSHQYHTPCIEQWLTMSSPNCPLDGLSLLHDH